MNEAHENKIVNLRIDDIIPNRFQPREIFDETGLQELSDSIKEHGVIQPIIVRQLGDKYELIAGERRIKASSMAGLTTIPGIIRNMDDKESAKVSLLENLQRKNLSAIEEARTYKRILELDNMTQEDLARNLGRSQPMVANKLRLLSLPEEIQEALMKNQISERHARSLLTIKNKKDQLSFLDKIRKERLTVRELDSEIKKFKENPEEFAKVSGIKNNNLNETKATEEERSFMNNNRGNFGGMGLNDYHSGVGNNMFNNIPNNFNNIPNMNSQPNEQFNYSNFDDKDEMNSNVQPNDYFTNMNQNNNQVGVTSSESLGSMFDNFNNQPENYQDDNNSNTNLFVSHIREDNLPKVDNQFLPNFDNFNQNEFNDNDDGNGSREALNNFNQNNEMSVQNTYQPNFDTNNSYNMMNNQDTYNMNNGYQSNYNQNNQVNNYNQSNMMNSNQFGIDNGMYNNNGFDMNNSTDLGNNLNQNIDINNGYNMNNNYNNVPNNNYFMNDLNNDINNQNSTMNNNSFNMNNGMNQTNNGVGINNNYNPNNNIDPSYYNSQIPEFNNNFSMNQNMYQPNQGGMFEQPLNIVDVPHNNTIEQPVTQNSNDLNSSDEINNVNLEVNNDISNDSSSNSISDITPLPEENTNLDQNEGELDENSESELEDTKEIPSIDSELEVIGEENQEKISNDLRNEPSKPQQNDYISIDPVYTINSTMDAVMELKKTTDRIKQNHINIETEEVDFDDVYQITIKIKKTDKL